MIVKTKSLTESLEKKYNYLIEDTDSLNESFVEEWWGQTDEDPFDFAYEYGLTCKEIGRQDDEILYRFTGEKEDFDQAIKDGYFFSLDYGADEGHSEDLNESFTLNEAENPDNAEINALIRKVVGRKNISKKDAKALADAGIERDENGDLTGKNGRRLVKYGTAIHGPSKTYLKRPRQRGEDVPAWRKTGKDNTVTRWDLRKNSGDYYGSKNADKWDKVDLKNYLDSEKPESEWETEQAMNQKLRPYSDKYQELKRQKANAEWDANWDSEKIKSEEEIEKLVQEYRDKLMKQRAYHMKELEKEEGSKEFYDKQIKDLQAQAKAKHPQYESLNEAANDSSPSLYDFFKAVQYWSINNEVKTVYCNADDYQEIYDEGTLNFIESHMDEVEYHEADILDGEIKIYVNINGLRESLNEAQLNENPLIAAAARAAIPAAINVASNAISSAIDAKLHDGNQDLNEDIDRADIVNKWWDKFDRDSGGMQLIHRLAKLTNKTDDEIIALNTVSMWKKFPDEGFLGYFSTDDIKKSLYGQDNNSNLEEDFYDPTSWFYDLVNNYETWSGEEWNSWSQEERDAAVTKAMKHFLIDNQLSEEEAEEFKHDLADNNFHTECRIFSELYGTI